MSWAFPRPAVPPAPMPAWRERADVETSSEGYARRFSGPVGGYFLETQAAILLEMLAPFPGARVLDVGGGHAQLAGRLLEKGFEVTVVGSEEVCRARLDRLLPQGSFEFHACDLLDLPFPDGSFDVVIAFRLLAHVPRWRELVAELCRVSNRVVVVDYSDVRSFNILYALLFPWKKKIEGNTRSFICFKPGEMSAELARHGFGQTSIRRQFFVPMVVHRALSSLGISRGLERVSRFFGLTRAFGSPVVLRAEREEELR